jgi:YD repeat-containing protein
MEHKRPAPRKTAKAVAATPADMNARPDVRGRIEVVETFFDHDGRPIKHKELDAARVSRAYDAQGHQIEERYFNAEGKPTVRKDLGAARISWRYDGDGRQVDTTFFGPDGAPVRRHTAPPRKRALQQA